MWPSPTEAFFGTPWAYLVNSSRNMKIEEKLMKKSGEYYYTISELYVGIILSWDESELQRRICDDSMGVAVKNLLWVGNKYQLSTTLSLDPVSSHPPQTKKLHYAIWIDLLFIPKVAATPWIKQPSNSKIYPLQSPPPSLQLCLEMRWGWNIIVSLWL